jgi:hypothetical protein
MIASIVKKGIVKLIGGVSPLLTNCLNFNGKNYAEMSEPKTFLGDVVFTVQFMITSLNESIIFGDDKSTSYALHININNGSVSLWSAGTEYTWSNVSAGLNDNNYHTLSVSVSTTGAELFVDGVSQGVSSSGTIYVGSNRFLLGRSNSEQGNFQGVISYISMSDLTAPTNDFISSMAYGDFDTLLTGKLYDTISGDVINNEIADDTVEYTDSVIVIDSMRSEQGFTRNDDFWFAANTDSIEKWSLEGNFLKSNAGLFADVPADVNHCGDICVHDNIIYCSMSKWDGISSTLNHLSLYRVSDLSFICTVSVPYGVSGVCISNDNKSILTCDFVKDTGITEIHRYDLNLNFIGAITLSKPLIKIQGIDNDGLGNIYINSAYDNNYTYVMNEETGVINSHVFKHKGEYGVENEGICIYKQMIHTHTRMDPIHQWKTPMVIGSSYLAIKSDVNTRPFKCVNSVGIAGTFIFRFKPVQFKSYRTIFDNTLHKDNWESWLDYERNFRIRINTTTILTVILDADALKEYVVCVRWEEKDSGANIQLTLDINGKREIVTSENVPTPDSLYFSSVNSGNDISNFILSGFASTDRKLTDSEVDFYLNNFNEIYNKNQNSINSYNLNSKSVVREKSEETGNINRLNYIDVVQGDWGKFDIPAVIPFVPVI